MTIFKQKHLRIANPISYIMFLISLIFQTRRLLINYCDILIPCLNCFIISWYVFEKSVISFPCQSSLRTQNFMFIIKVNFKSYQLHPNLYSSELYIYIALLTNYIILFFSKQLHINISLLLWVSKFIPVSVIIVESSWCLKCM